MRTTQRRLRRRADREHRLYAYRPARPERARYDFRLRHLHRVVWQSRPARRGHLLNDQPEGDLLRVRQSSFWTSAHRRALAPDSPCRRSAASRNSFTRARTACQRRMPSGWPCSRSAAIRASIKSPTLSSWVFNALSASVFMVGRQRTGRPGSRKSLEPTPAKQYRRSAIRQLLDVHQASVHVRNRA